MINLYICIVRYNFCFMKPTIEFYTLFQFIYDYYNVHLFENKLPNCMIVITRKTYTLGYYSNERWENKSRVKTDELAMNPMYFSKRSILEILQTMAHEMCHVWQFHYGKRSRGGYHNKEWGRKMESIGLMPSNTGQIGGKKTGQQMMDYPISNGEFLKVSGKLIKEKIFETFWIDRTIKPKVEVIMDNWINQDLGSNKFLQNANFEKEIINLLSEKFDVDIPVYDAPQDSSKSKYTCPNCYSNVWGKRNLSIICGLCDCEFDEN